MEARTDNLTGLGNHRAFHHDLALEVQRRAQTGSVFALMAIDLDGLKQINDSPGPSGRRRLHPAGLRDRARRDRDAREPSIAPAATSS